MSAIGLKYSSQVNPQLEYSSSVWLVSLQNVKCHSRIILEGIRSGMRFVGQYEVGHYIDTADVVRGMFQKKIGNTPGVITRIDVFEETNYVHDYTKYHSKSWFVSPGKSEAMIAKIKEEQAAIAQEKEAYDATGDIRVFTHLYQRAGSERSAILGGNGGHSCVTWAEKMLAIGHAGNGVKLIDSIKAVPEAHVIKIGWPTIILSIVTTSVVAAKWLKR